MKIKAKIKIIVAVDFFHTQDIVWICFNFGYWINYKVSQYNTYTYTDFMSERFNEFIYKARL